MKNNVYKIILITMIALVSMIIAASANTATIDGTYNEGVVTINVSGVGINDEVFLLAVPANQKLSEIENKSNPNTLVKYVEQKTADDGSATFTFATDTENIDVYLSYSSMRLTDAVLLKEFGTSLINEPTVDTTNSKLYTSVFTLEGFQRIFIKLTEGAGQWMPTHSDAESAIFYSAESQNYEGIIKSTAADIDTALGELSWKNVAPTADQTIAMYGDMTGDGIINILDFADISSLNSETVKENYGSAKDYLTADVDGNGSLNILDFVQLKAYIDSQVTGETYTFAKSTN